jgi:hypothetical protein
VWDIYEDVHHFMADGFPISKFVTHGIAQQFPAVPMVNGFMGDSLVRASNDRLDGQSEEAWCADLAGALQQKHLAISLNLFRPHVSSAILERARLPMTDVMSRAAGKAFAYADLYLRQRHYISNNFLQHLDVSEAVLPFYSWRLMAYKLAHSPVAFSPETYHRIFAQHYPQLADVPHASAVKTHQHQAPLPECAVRWARGLLTPLCRPDWLSLLSKRTCLTLIALGAARLPSMNQRLAPIVEDAVFTCRRIHLLERRVKNAGLRFEWGALSS